jgi:flagellar basal body-associated protein FliL
VGTKSVRKSRLLLITILLILTITVPLFGVYVVGNISSRSATIPVKVEDPIEILNYPAGINLYPGQTKEFSLNVQNIADVTYTVALDFQLNDSSYQSRYVTFENTVFMIAPGEQTLNASLTVFSRRATSEPFLDC